MRIEVESTKVITTQGLNKKTGESFETYEQNGLMYLDGSKACQLIKFGIPNPDQPYEIGMYELDEMETFYINFQKLNVKRNLVLKSIDAERGGIASVS